MLITLKNVRLAFPDLFKVDVYQGNPIGYGAQFIIDGRDKEQIGTIDKAIEEVAKEKWAAKAESVLKTIRNNPQKFCFHEGDLKEYDGFAGNMVISARSSKKPAVVDRDRTDLTEDSGRPYSGCYVYAKIVIWAQDNAYGKAIRAELQGVQFFRNGDAFAGSGRPLTSDDFEDLADDNDDLI